jgi:alkyl sulfatase BDS1-like metallo-beta-lactamase superfamily hydrolase
MPEDMKGKLYLGEAYGCLNFVIHGIYYRYGGWYNGHPTEMFPARRQDIAAEVVKVGGAAGLVSRVRELRAEGKIQLALNLLDFVVDGGTTGAARKEALLLRAQLLDERARQEPNGMAKNTFLRGAEAAEQEAKSL